MSLKSKFLTLPMKEQIYISIILLTSYSLLTILLLTCSFCYEILQEDFKRKKLYFYDRYKDYVESCFFYHNFIILQYEEMIKRMQNQIFKYHQKALFFNYSYNFNNDFTQYKVSMFNPDDYAINSNNEIYQDEEKLFYYCYFPNSTLCNFFGEFARAKYNSLSSIIFATDLYKYFRIPGYEASLIDDPILVNVNRSTMFSFNASNIYNNLNGLLGGYSDSKKTQLIYYYQKKVGYMMSNIYTMYLYYFANILFCFNHLFGNTENEIYNLDEVAMVNKDNMTTLYEFAKIISGYYSIVNFPENKFSLISYSNNQYYYIECNLIENYLYYINNKFCNFLDVSIIALNYENNTLISPELCILFLLKQYNYKYETYISKLEEFKNIISGKSNITDCFIDPEAFWEQLEINDIFQLNISHFLHINNSIAQGIVKTGNTYYYYMKYSYPSYSVLKEFLSDYLLLNQVNFYLFVSFKDPIDYSNLVYQVNSNCFHLIILLVVYIWGICLFINLLIYCKVEFQLTEPIYKLQEAIESSSLKDENIFKYEYDEVINELFLTSKELLSGQIDMNNDEKGMGQFNILSKPKDKDKNLDNNLYKKNLIINNDIMNKLIMEQQNMMDFSKNIKINEELDILDEPKHKIFDKINNSQIIEDNLNLPLDNKESSSKKNNVNQNVINEVKDKEPYKRLFKIAEYLFYYQNKIENNFINIINNIITDDSKKSSISKISNNINTTNPSKMKNFVRGNSYGKPDENENFSINMLDNRSMTYLWYMESKKRKNKSFNFQINENYDELFKDYNYYQNNYENSIKKGNINIESDHKNI